MDDAYGLLLSHKISNESFSDELRRVLTKRRARTLADYFGILTDEEGEKALKAIERRRELNRELLKKERRAL